MNKVKKIISITLLICMASLIVMAFSACVSDNYTDQATKLQDKGYTVNSIEYTQKPEMVWVVDGTKQVAGEMADYVRVYYFTSEDAAIAYYNETFLEGIEALKAESAIQGRPNLADDFDHLQVANLIVYGTKKGVSDALA